MSDNSEQFQKIRHARFAGIAILSALPIAAVLNACGESVPQTRENNAFIRLREDQTAIALAENPQTAGQDLNLTPVTEPVTPTVSRSDGFESVNVIKGTAYPVIVDPAEIPTNQSEVTLRQENLDGNSLFIFEVNPKVVDIQLVNAQGINGDWNNPKREIATNAFARETADGQDLLALFNGDYFGSFGGEGTSIRNGELIHLGYRASLVIYRDGRVAIKVVTQEDVNKGDIAHAIGGGPKIMDVVDGSVKVASLRDDVIQTDEIPFDSLTAGFDPNDPNQVQYRKHTYRDPYAQMIVAIRHNADGSQTLSMVTTAGASGYNIAKFLRENGYHEALCFDSGGSTQSIIKDENTGQAKPILIMQDANGARPVANFLGIFRRR